MTAVLLPRLDSAAVEQCLSQLAALVAEAPRRLTPDRFPASTRYAASGGGQAEVSQLNSLRDQILAAARECGFPDRGSTENRSRFDRLASAVLADFPPFQSGETDRDDVWAFIATILMPDVVTWRFAGQSTGRFEGGIRNTFQRLWIRARALDRGTGPDVDRWQYLEALSEDALVQLTERPSIGADPKLCRAIAAAWVTTAARIGTGRMEDVMRRAIIALRIRNEIQMLGALSEPVLDQLVLEIFSSIALSEKPDKSADTPTAATLAEVVSSTVDAKAPKGRFRAMASSIFKRN